MRRESGAVGQVGLLLGQQALEAQHERVLAPPGQRGIVAALLDLGQRGVEGPPASGAGGQGRSGVLALEHEGLASEALGAFELGAGNRHLCGLLMAVSHLGLFFE